MANPVTNRRAALVLFGLPRRARRWRRIEFVLGVLYTCCRDWQDRKYVGAAGTGRYCCRIRWPGEVGEDCYSEISFPVAHRVEQGQILFGGVFHLTSPRIA